jgi:hypothetical protein
MTTLHVQAPDGKTLNIPVPDGTDPSKYDSIVDDVMKDYTANNPGTPEGPGMLKSGALGLMSGVPGAEAAVSGVESALDPKTTYAQAHQGLEDQKDAAWNAHPVAYGAGKGAGFVGTALAAPVAETLGGAAAVGAGIGALSGADAASDVSDIPSAAVKGAGTGALVGGAGNLVSKAVSAAPSAAKSILASLGSETTPSDISEYLARPGAINAAPTQAELGTKIAGTANDITKASGHLSQEARGLLNNKPAMTGDDLQKLIEQAKQQYMRNGVVKTGMEPAVNALDSELERFQQMSGGGSGPSEQDVRGFIDDLQKATKDSTFGNPDAGAKQGALKNLSGQMNDSLRTANPDYAGAMAPSAEAADASSDLQDQFKLENGQPTDATMGKVKNLTKEGKSEGAAALGKAQAITGQDLMQQVHDAGVADRFNAPGAGGAMKTLAASMGFGLGKMTGVPYGGIGGAAAGRFGVEGMAGAQSAKGILDAYMAVRNNPVAGAAGSALQKFGPILAKAAQTGGNELAATHFVLATSNPEYQQLVEDHSGNNAQSDGSNGYHP